MTTDCDNNWFGQWSPTPGG